MLKGYVQNYSIGFMCGSTPNHHGYHRVPVVILGHKYDNHGSNVFRSVIGIRNSLDLPRVHILKVD